MDRGGVATLSGPGQVWGPNLGVHPPGLYVQTGPLLSEERSCFLLMESLMKGCPHLEEWSATRGKSRLCSGSLDGPGLDDGGVPFTSLDLGAAELSPVHTRPLPLYQQAVRNPCSEATAVRVLSEVSKTPRKDS